MTGNGQPSCIDIRGSLYLKFISEVHSGAWDPPVGRLCLAPCQVGHHLLQKGHMYRVMEETSQAKF